MEDVQGNYKSLYRTHVILVLHINRL